MASISEDLNSYLSRSTSSTALSSVTSKLSSFKLPTLNQIKGTVTDIRRPENFGPQFWQLLLNAI